MVITETGHAKAVSPSGQHLGSQADVITVPAEQVKVELNAELGHAANVPHHGLPGGHPAVEGVHQLVVAWAETHVLFDQPTQYGLRVPVVLVDGEERFEVEVDPDELRRLLA